MERTPWKVSLHGGHSGDYCDHAEGPLIGMVQAAIDAGLDTWGVTEHAPRVAERHLYDEERRRGWDNAKVAALFDAYAHRMEELIPEYADRITLLKGFEAEIVPRDRYVDLMLGWREQYKFEYMIGSVHYIEDDLFDMGFDVFNRVKEKCGGWDKLGVKYYEHIAEMVLLLKPEVVGHLDLIRQYSPDEETVATPAIREAAIHSLDIIAEHGCILDVNLAGFRKGIGRPYVAPWLLKEAQTRGIGVCFGDDSHHATQVALNMEKGRQYLLDNGYDNLTVLAREEGKLVKREVGL